jgi:branched-chain amino acid aminotransferase
MGLARAADVPVFERNMARQDVYTADECFLTGTGAEIVPVTKIDNRLIKDGKPGPVTGKLLEAFHRKVRGG